MTRYHVLDPDPTAAVVRARRNDVVATHVVVRRSPCTDPQVAERLRAVAERVAELGDPRLVAAVDAHLDGDTLVVVHPDLPGSRLADLLARRALDHTAALALTTALLEALARLHAAGLTVGGIDPGQVAVGATDGHLDLRLPVTGRSPSIPARDVQATLEMCGSVLPPAALEVIERLRSHPPLEAGPAATALRAVAAPPKRAPTAAPVATPHRAEVQRPRLVLTGTAAVATGAIVGTALSLLPR